MTKIDTSIILIPSNDIRLLHKTVLNLTASLDTTGTPITYELLLDDDTLHRDYVERYPHDHIRFVSVNKALAGASGEFIAFIEEGSLVSPSWIYDSLTSLRVNSTSIHHTEATIFSNKEINCLWMKHSSQDDSVLLSLAVKNQWDYPLIGHKDAFSIDPLDDLWFFNTETITKGYEHIATPKTAHFSRVTPDFNALPSVRHSSLFSSERYTSLSVDDESTAETSARHALGVSQQVKETLRRGHVWAKRRSRVYKAIVMPLLTSQDKRSIGKKIPDWALAAWKEVHTYDRTTFPTRDNLHALFPYTSLSVGAGSTLHALLSRVSAKPDYVIMSQHMMKGGGDKVILNYIDAIQTLEPTWKLALIITEPFENNWKDRVPNTVDFIDFGNSTKQFDQYIRYALLMRLTVQTQTRRMMLAMTPFGFELIEHFADDFKRDDYQIDTVAFCSDTDTFGRTWGIHFFGIPETFSLLHHIFTDNQQVIDETLALEPLERTKFKVHYQPAHFALQAPKERTNTDKISILWASRVANQKRPDVVVNIAKKLDPAHYHIDMYGNLEDEYTEEDLSGIPALTYKQGFDGFNSLPLEKYDALLYTSSFDGVPNILLEASAAGLPVIAPSVGGVGEFVLNKKTGLLIDDVDAIDAYVESLEYLRKNPDEGVKFVLAAQDRLNTQHSYENFKKHVADDLIG